MVQKIKYRPAEAADYLGCKESTLAWWRSRGKGPNFLRVGGRIFYLQEQLDAFLEAGICEPGAAA